MSLTTTVPATCPTCERPIKGRGRCRDYRHEHIGPRRVGTVWQEQIGGRFIGRLVEVVAINPTGEGIPTWMGWSITEKDLDGPDAGRLRTHCTAWRTGRAAVVKP